MYTQALEPLNGNERARVWGIYYFYNISKLSDIRWCKIRKQCTSGGSDYLLVTKGYTYYMETTWIILANVSATSRRPTSMRAFANATPVALFPLCLFHLNNSSMVLSLTLRFSSSMLLMMLDDMPNFLPSCFQCEPTISDMSFRRVSFKMWFPTGPSGTKVETQSFQRAFISYIRYFGLYI